MTQTFGALLRHLRRRQGMTQDALAARLGYSRSMIAALEVGQRQPDLDAVAQRYVAALGLADAPDLAAELVTLAAQARNEIPAAAVAYHRTHAGRPSGATSGATSAVKPSAPPYYRAPLPPTPMLGRTREIKRVCTALLENRTRLLTLVGPPGVGKTHLALAAAAQMQPFYSGGVCFVPLAAVETMDALFVALLTTLEVSGNPARPPIARLIAHLRQSEMLLLLDNFEQLVAAAPLLADLLAHCPRLALLVTSRERLRLRAEEIATVAPLPLEDAAALFTVRALAVDESFPAWLETSPQHVQTVRAICTRLDALPLAIELAAAQLLLLSPESLLARLDNSALRLLVDGAVDLPPRQQTLRAAIDFSYHLLAPDARHLLRALAVFAGGCTLEMVAAVAVPYAHPAEDALDSSLRQLVNKSLVAVRALSSGEKRFLLLESIREYARERTEREEAGEGETFARRHFTVMLHLVRMGDAHLRGVDAPLWMKRLDAEQDNLRAALRHALDQGAYADAGLLFNAAHYYWVEHGLIQEAAQWLGALETAKQSLAPDQQLMLALVHNMIAFFLDAPEPVSQQASALADSLDDAADPLLAAWAWYWKGALSPVRVDAIAALEESIARARACIATGTAGVSGASGASNENLWGAYGDVGLLLGQALWGLAGQMMEAGDVARAESLCRECIEVSRARGNLRMVGMTSVHLGELALAAGDLDEARQRLDEAVAIGERLHLVDLLSLALAHAGNLYARLGEIERARRLLTDALAYSVDRLEAERTAFIRASLASLEPHASG